MPKYNSNVQKQWQDFNLLKILLKNSETIVASFFCILWCYFQSDFQSYFKMLVCGPFFSYISQVIYLTHIHYIHSSYLYIRTYIHILQYLQCTLIQSYIKQFTMHYVNTFVCKKITLTNIHLKFPQLQSIPVREKIQLFSINGQAKVYE